MECTFQSGDRVVCVGVRRPSCPVCHDSDGDGDWGNEKIGKIFTVGRVWHFGGGRCAHGIEHPPGVAITLKERPDWTRGYYAASFRHVKPLSFWVGEKEKIKA